MGTQMRVARVDIESESGRDLARQYGITAVPAYVLVRPDGAVLYRQVGGRPDATEIARRVSGFRRGGS